MKTKTFLLTIAMFFSIQFISAQTQVKYDFMIIQLWSSFKNEIQISINGEQTIEEKADYGTTQKGNYNPNPLLKKVKDYQDKGWELMSFQTNSLSNDTQTYFAYLRKKQE